MMPKFIPLRPLIILPDALGVTLSNGTVLYIDIEDRAVAEGWNWTACVSAGKVYAVRWVRIKRGSRKTRRDTRKCIWLHRLIVNAPLGLTADHIDGDTLNCRRRNLRIATQAQNSRNKKKPRDNTSGFKGAYRSGNAWCAAIRFQMKKIYLGRFSSREEAARAYDQAAIRLYGEFARINGIAA